MHCSNVAMPMISFKNRKICYKYLPFSLCDRRSHAAAAVAAHKPPFPRKARGFSVILNTFEQKVVKLEECEVILFQPTSPEKKNRFISLFGQLANALLLYQQISSIACFEVKPTKSRTLTAPARLHAI